MSNDLLFKVLKLPEYENFQEIATDDWRDPTEENPGMSLSSRGWTDHRTGKGGKLEYLLKGGPKKIVDIDKIYKESTLRPEDLEIIKEYFGTHREISLTDEEIKTIGIRVNRYKEEIHLVTPMSDQNGKIQCLHKITLDQFFQKSVPSRLQGRSESDRGILLKNGSRKLIQLEGLEDGIILWQQKKDYDILVTGPAVNFKRGLSFHAAYDEVTALLDNDEGEASIKHSRHLGENVKRLMPAEVGMDANEAIRQGCFNGWWNTLKEIPWSYIESKLGEWDFHSKGDGVILNKEVLSDDIWEWLKNNEDGDAQGFNYLNNGKFIPDHASNSWYVWKEHYWQEDVRDEAMGGIDQLIGAYAVESEKQGWAGAGAQTNGRPDEAAKCFGFQKLFNKRINELQTAKRKKNILFLARVGRGLRGDEWDRDPMLLCCQNGVIDLRTGEIRDGTPEDYIKTFAPTIYNGVNYPCVEWEKFLNDIFDNDQELIRYFQRLLGYGITGLSILHLIVVLWGRGRNGKSCLVEVIKHVMGSLSHKVESEMLLEQRYSRQAGTANSAVLGLRGRRLVWCSETSEGRQFDVSKVKELVGGDTLNARGMYAKHSVEFTPSHLMMLLTNHKPEAPANDYAFWQRVAIIPFQFSYVEDPQQPHERKVDQNLTLRLKGEASGILSWLVRGCLSWQKEGLNPPLVVKNATQEYKKEVDMLQRFIDECCLLSSELKVKSSIFYSAYDKWSRENGFHPMTGTRFGKEIKEYFSWEKSSHIFYLGVGIKNYEI